MTAQSDINDTISILRLSGRTDKATRRQGQRQELTWSALVAMMTEHANLEDKSRGLGFAPVTMADAPCTCGANDCPVELGHFIGPNVLAINVLMLDVDKYRDGRQLDQSGAERAMDRLRTRDIRHVVASSHSHRYPDHAAFRAAIALTRPVTVDEWPVFFAAATGYLDVEHDATCSKTIGRFWYAPAHPPGAEPIAYAHDGRPLDVDMILAIARAAPRAEPPKPSPRPRPCAPTEGAFDIRDAMARWLPGVRCEPGGGKAIARWHVGPEGCPRAHDHGSRGAPSKSTVFLYDDGAWEFICQSTSHENLDHDDFREHYEPGWIRFSRRPPTNGHGNSSSREPPPDIVVGARERLVDGLVMVDEADEIEAIAARDREPKLTALSMAEVAQQDAPPVRSYASGFAELDVLIGGGISTRGLTSVLGPPGAGKSAFAIAVSLRVALAAPVLYASTELEGHELMSRGAANLVGCSWSTLVREPRSSRLLRVGSKLDGVRIHLLGSDVIPADGAKALALIEREAAAIAKLYGAQPIVVIDYLQDLARGTEREVRAQVGALATQLRAMSQRLDCAVIVVSSVARAYYNPERLLKLRQMDDPTVYLAAAKESGDVDYASATVIFLDVAEEDAATSTRPARIAVAKARHGRTGFVNGTFAGASGRWVEASAGAALSKEGRETRAVAVKIDDADEKVFAALARMHSRGERKLCTTTQLRTRCGIGATRVPPALERLVFAGRVRQVALELEEGDKKRKREIWEPVPNVDKRTPEST